MKQSKLKNILKKTSDYFIGVGDNDYYDYAEQIVKNFLIPDEAKFYIKELKRNKKEKILTKNVINIAELLAVGIIMIEEPSYTFALSMLSMSEATRYVCHKIDSKAKQIILKDKKYILKQFQEDVPQTLDEIKQEYDRAIGLDPGDFEDEEWKYR